jgi:protein-tyrosine phosphatase
MFEIVDNKLATEGIGQFPTPKALSKGKYQSNILTPESWPVLDVRDYLYDNGFNPIEVYDKLIDLAWDLIQKHGRVVICCVAGISRSNAIALGALVRYFHMDFYDAWDFINSRVPISNIDPGHISQLKKLLNTTIP